MTRSGIISVPVYSDVIYFKILAICSLSFKNIEMRRFYKLHLNITIYFLMI